MIQVVIFSFNRAMQLDSLIESIFCYDNSNSLDLTVLYSYSSAAYKEGYDLLKKKHPSIVWKEEKVEIKPVFDFNFDFFTLRNWYWWFKYPVVRRKKSDFKHLLITTIKESKHDLLMFLTDDSLFYREIIIPQESIQRMIDTSGKTSFSLVHGANIEGGVYTIEKDIIQLNIKDNDEKTWGYPFSVDGHIYLKNKILPVLKNTIFNNPNTLEGNLCAYVKKRQLFPYLIANRESCLIGFELNRVQDVFPNNHLNISSEILNNYFINNYSLNIDYCLEKDFQFRPKIKSIKVVKGNEKISLLSG